MKKGEGEGAGGGGGGERRRTSGDDEEELIYEGRGNEGQKGEGVDGHRSTVGASWYKMFSLERSHTHHQFRLHKNETHSAGLGGMDGGFTLT